MTMTYHGEARMKERAGIGKSAKKIERMAKNALERGCAHKNTKGALRRYLDDKFNVYGQGNNMRVYAGQLFIFEEERLITVYPLPSKFQNNITNYVSA